MTNQRKTSKTPISAVVRAMGRVIRPRYTARIEDSGQASTLTGGGQKLEPIEDIVARSRRAPRAPD